MKQGLPVIERPLDNTALTAYMSCPREFLYSMVMHRRSPGKSAALTFGSAWHHALEALYKGEDVLKAVEFALSKWGEKPPPDEYRTPERLILSLKQYVDKWPLEKDRKQTIGYPDMPLVEAQVNAMDEKIIHPYAGKIDRVINDGLILSEDHKSTSRLDKNTFMQYEGSNQMKGYTYLADTLITEHRVTGIRINLIHITKTKTDFHRQLVTFTSQQIQEWADNYNAWVRRIALDLLLWHWEKLQEDPDDYALPGGYSDWDDLCADSGYTSLYVESMADKVGGFPAHFGDNGCSRKYGLCQFFHVCKLNPANQNRVLTHEFELNPWNPLEVDDEE